MPIDVARAAADASRGLAVTCALCVFHHEAADRGQPSCGKQCGGPMSGGAFELYKGPITDFSQQCFACGIVPTHLVRAKNIVRVLGSCQKHTDMIQQYRAVDKPPATIIMISKDGTQSSDETIPQARVVKIKL